MPPPRRAFLVLGYSRQFRIAQFRTAQFCTASPSNASASPVGCGCGESSAQRGESSAQRAVRRERCAESSGPGAAGGRNYHQMVKYDSTTSHADGWVAMDMKCWHGGGGDSE